MPIQLSNPSFRRRDFLAATATAIAAAAVDAKPLAASAIDDPPRVPLGLDGHSLRGMNWKATQHIEFAAAQRLDAVLLNGLNYFESLEESHLLNLKDLARRHDMRIYVGAGGICKNAARFSKRWGDPDEVLATGIRVASTLGSPVVNVRIGSIADRFLEGGIQPRIDEAVRVLRAFRRRAQDAGIKFGFENHAADLRSEELLELVEEVGTDVCGVMLDPGMPIFVESISNSSRPIPFLTQEYWRAYPDLKATGIVDFLKLCRRGRAIKIDQPPPGTDENEFEQQHQRTEFLNSIEYLRKHCGAGLKS